MFEKTKINKKEAGVGHFFKKIQLETNELSLQILCRHHLGRHHLVSCASKDIHFRPLIQMSEKNLPCFHFSNG